MKHWISCLLLCGCCGASVFAQVQANPVEPGKQPAPNDPISPHLRNTAQPTTRPVPQISRALVISIDGLRPDLLLLGKTPVLHSMMERGAYSMWARTTPNSITLPSHMSMMTGVSPRRHDVEWNREFKTEKPLYPAVPTLFEVAKRHGYTTAVAAGKVKFEMFDRPGVLDWKSIPTKATIETAMVAPMAAAIIKEHKPQVMLVHFPSVDNRGHQIGWGSPEQMQAIADADAGVGVVLQALQDAGLADSTLVIVSADHGGAGRTHGPEDPRSRHIPWIATGPGVRQHVDLANIQKLVINTEDTFATVCWVLGIPPAIRDIEGVPVTAAFERKDSELLQSMSKKAPLKWDVAW